MLARFFEKGNDLFALYARKAFQKLLDRIAGFQMIEKAFHRYARPDEDWLAAENIRILRDDLAHWSNCNSKPPNLQRYKLEICFKA